MTRLVLHVGQPKTGTTALQSVLAANADALLSQASVLYPTRTTPTEGKHAFAIPWLLGVDNAAIRRRARASGDALRQLSHGYWRSVIAEVEQARPDVLVLSAEGFWIVHQAAAERRLALRQELYGLAEHVTVAGYLKSPASYFLSMLNQKLRNYRPVRMPRPDFYRATLQAWEAVGLDACCWRVFARPALRNGDIVDDFCSQYLPSSVQGMTLQRQGVERANASVSNEALVILEELACRYPVLVRDVYDRRRSPIVEMLRQADADLGGRCRPSLKDEAAAALVQQCDDLGWLQERGLCFDDVDPALIHSRRTSSLGPYSQVADYCPIDQQRLQAMRAMVMDRIAALFRPEPAVARYTRRIWPFSGRPQP